jgi:biopolymer transport protein ExbB
MTVAIQCFLEFKREKVLPAYFINELQTCIEEDDIDGAIDACEREDLPMARIMGHVFSRYDGGASKMADAMVEASDEEANIWSVKIAWLALIGGTAPMLGLFGTVSGMITAFDQISKAAGTASPEMLAKGIMEALVTTYIGLFVAIPTLFAYQIIKNKMNTLLIEQANACSDLLDRATQQ